MHKDSRTNEQNRIETRNKYVDLWSVDFQLNWQDNSTGKGLLLHQMVLKPSDTHIQKQKLNKRLFHTTKNVNSRLIKDFNVEAKIIKFLEKNTGENVSELGLGKEFFNRT